MLFGCARVVRYLVLRVRGCGSWGWLPGLGGCCQVGFEAPDVDEAADGVNFRDLS